MKKIIAGLLAAAMALSMCACSDDDDTSVKLPDSSTVSIDTSLSYEDAILSFEYDEKLVEIASWAEGLYNALKMVYYYDVNCESSYTTEEGRVYSNFVEENGVKTMSYTESLNKAGELLNSEADYTAYVDAKDDAAFKAAFDKFTTTAQLVYQEYTTTPPTCDDNGDVTIETDPCDLDRYYNAINADITYDTYHEAVDYLRDYVCRVYQRFLDAEYFVWYTASETSDAEWLSISDDATGYEGRIFYSMFGTYHWKLAVGEDYPDFLTEQIRLLLSYKANFDAVAAEACTLDADLKNYVDFMEEAEKQYNILVAHRPTGGDTSYFEKYDFNLDDLEDLFYKVIDIK